VDETTRNGVVASFTNAAGLSDVVQVTVDLYGHLIPGGNKQAVDRLDAPVEKSQFSGQSATQTQPH
jgi:hypothetical protein